MATIANSVRKDPSVGALAALADDWLPTLLTDADLAAACAAFLKLVAFKPGPADGKVLTLGTTPRFPPTLTPAVIPSDGGGTRTHAYVTSRAPNHITLNRNLVEAATALGTPEALTYLRGKVLHELIHWAELQQDDHGAGGLFHRATDHGRMMENLFHGRAATDGPVPMPADLLAAVQAREAAARPSSVTVATRQNGALELDGRQSPASALTGESDPLEAETLARALAREEPVLALAPLPEHEDPDGDRFDTPDFAHLAEISSEGRGLGFDSRPFKVDHDALALFCALNDIAPDGTERVLFGLRGADLDPPEGKSHQPLALLGHVAEARFDHDVRRCVLGVWDRQAREVALFEGSTVPNRTNMKKQIGQADGDRILASTCNMLPTGRYRYVCGAHRKTLNGAFVMAEKVVVLRSCNDMRYGLDDIWDACRPGDNIHPAFRGSGVRTFSSAGCQTVAGDGDGGSHTGDWAAFRKAAGLLRSGKADHGRRFDYLLLTAREMRLMRFLLDRCGGMPGAADIAALAAHYGRLRFGASGLRVAALQKALGAGQDGTFGPQTAMALIAAQRRLGRASDGLCTPDLAAALGLPTAAAAPDPAARTAPTPAPALGLDLPVRRGDRRNANVTRVQQLLNRLGAMVTVDGNYGAETSVAVAVARARLAVPGRPDAVDLPLATALAAQPPLSAKLSTEGAVFICLTEIGSTAAYRARYKAPHWPGEQSGITIGVGYDLRFVDDAKLRRDWRALPTATLAALAPFCGARGSAAKARGLAGHSIPLTDAIHVYLKTTLPDKLAETRRAYPELDTLPALCAAALVSLVNNRGASLKPDPRRLEMVRVAEALTQRARWAEIPGHFRTMKRLWPQSQGLRDRRDAEAELFRRGLADDPRY